MRIDLQLSQVEYNKDLYENVYVHSGFKTQYDSIRDQVYHFVAEKCKANKPKRLLITGHSLGGSLATLCALDLVLNPLPNGLPVMKVITFGAPQVGNERFVEIFNQNVPDCYRLAVLLFYKTVLR